MKSILLGSHSNPDRTKAPRVGLEPTTPRLTAACSTIELSRNVLIIKYFKLQVNPQLRGIFKKLTCVTLKTEHRNLPNSLTISSNSSDKPFRTSPRSISDSPLSVLPHLHLSPIYLVVFKGSYFLTNGISHLEGGFTLRCLQRLSLPDLATLLWSWSPTGTPAVRPSRSSRTKDSSSQISYAHAG